MDLAHVIAPPGNHLVFLWPTCAVAAAGVVLAVAVRRLRWRRTWTAVATVGVAATVVVYIVEPPSTGPPPYSLRLAIATAPGDLAVEVCPVVSAVATPAVPGPGRLIDVFLDGRVAAESASRQFVLRTAPGPHAIAAELVQGNHVEFVPRAVTSTSRVTVPAGPGSALPPVSC